MPSAATAAEVFEREFLAIRGKLLEVAAGLDRVARGSGEVVDPRMEQLRRAVEVLGTAGTDRAERIQMLFSLPYDPQWRA